MDSEYVHSDIYADWELMSERYLPGRARLLTSMAASIGEREPALVVDLGCGPATVAHSLTLAIPTTEVVGVDHDPALLVLARRRASASPRLRIVDARIDGDWRVATGRPVDAVVTVLTLHYFTREVWPSLLASIAGALTPGGLFVNVDVFPGSDDLDGAHLLAVDEEMMSARSLLDWDSDWDG